MLEGGSRMGILDKIKSALVSISEVENLVKAWKPRGCATEKDFENSLHNYLEKKLKGVEIIKQYARGRTKVDLAIANKIFLELKKDLKNKSQFITLIGQMEDYPKQFDNIMIVICGEADKNLLKRVIDKKKAYDWDIWFDCRVLHKKISAKIRKGYSPKRRF